MKSCSLTAHWTGAIDCNHANSSQATMPQGWGGWGLLTRSLILVNNPMKVRGVAQPATWGKGHGAMPCLRLHCWCTTIPPALPKVRVYPTLSGDLQGTHGTHNNGAQRGPQRVRLASLQVLQRRLPQQRSSWLKIQCVVEVECSSCAICAMCQVPGSLPARFLLGEGAGGPMSRSKLQHMNSWT